MRYKSKFLFVTFVNFIGRAEYDLLFLKVEGVTRPLYSNALGTSVRATLSSIGCQIRSIPRL